MGVERVEARHESIHATAPQLIAQHFQVNVWADLLTRLGRLEHFEADRAPWREVGGPERGGQGGVALRGAEQLCGDLPCAGVPEGLDEGCQGGHEVGLDVTGVGHGEGGGDAVGVGLDGENAERRPPLVDRHLAYCGQVGDPFDGEAGDPLGKQEPSRRAEDVGSHLVERPSPATAPPGAAIGRSNRVRPSLRPGRERGRLFPAVRVRARHGFDGATAGWAIGYDCAYMDDEFNYGGWMPEQVNLEKYRQALPPETRALAFSPGADEYDTATTPRNTTAAQTPAAVLLASRAEHVAAAVQAAARTGFTIAPQATGHGAAGDLDGEVILLDTSGMNHVEIDADRRVARVGAGATFGQINAAAYRHGLLAPGGTAPDVAVVGYTALGGVGWLTRPHGLASASLRSVDVVDGLGQAVHADDEQHEDLVWVFRGGGGAGIATTMELALYPADELRAGYLLWPVEHATAVLPTWGRALATFHPALATGISVLHAPDAPTVPEPLRGKPVVHLCAATVAGPAGEDSLRRLLATLPTPAIDTFGPADADRLAMIHLDPPAPVPAIGEGRWLTDGAAGRVFEILTAAGTGTDSPLAEVELRHVAAPASSVPGALTSVPGNLLLHATGPVPKPEARHAVLRSPRLGARRSGTGGRRSQRERVPGRTAARHRCPPG